MSGPNPAVPPDAPKPGPSNKRRATRRPPRNHARVLCYGNAHGLGPNLAVQLLDLSETGVRIVLKAPLPVGQAVEVGLEAAAQRTKLPAQVIWIVETSAGTYCAGLKFDKSLSYATLQQLARI